MTTINHGGRMMSDSPVITSTAFSHSVDDCLPAAAIGVAVRLVGAVHEQGPSDVAAIIGRLDTRELRALAVTLAALVPDDYSPAELLAWNDSRYTTRVTPVASTQPPLFPAIAVTRQLKPHGTHAAFMLHRKHREEPCAPCWHGEREYQRNRKRRNRADERQSA